MKKKKETWGRYLLYYSALFVIVAAGVFIWYLLEQKSLCWTRDTSAQYIPKAYYFAREGREFLRNLMQGEWTFRMYDFQIGFGDAVPLHMEPIYWLYLIFGEKHIEVVYGILILLRYYLAGLSISVFMKYFKYNNWQCLTGSMVYIFSGYALYEGLRHSHFIIPMITLPCMLLAMEEIYRQKRWYLCTLTVALSFWCGYYFTYMNTIMMGCYFLIRFFFGEEERSIKRFMLRMRTIIGSYLLGIGIANITFFTTFSGYLTSSRTGTTVQKVSLWSYGSRWIQKLFQSFLSASYTPGNWMRLGFIALSYLAIVLLFIRRKNMQLKIGFAVATLFCIVPVFGYVFSGFGTITNRWCYGYAFIVALITAKMAEQLKEVTAKELVILGISVLPYLYFGIGKKMMGIKYERSVVYAGMLLLVVYILIVLLHFAKRMSGIVKNGTILGCAVVLLWASGVLFFSPSMGNKIAEYTNMGKVESRATNTPLKVLDEVEDDSFYRSFAEQPTTTQGASMILGYNGVEYFSSTISGAISDFYRETGLTSWALIRLNGLDNRGFLNALSCVKYIVMKEGEEYAVPYGFQEVKEVLRNKTYYKIYENQNVLPIAYCYDQVITTEELEKAEAGQRQEVMLQAAVVEQDSKETNAGKVTVNDLQITGKKLTVTDITTDENIEFDGKTITVNKAGATMTVYFDGLEDSETYLYIKGLSMKNNKKIWMYLGTDQDSEAQAYCIRGDQETYHTRQEEYLMNLGYSRKGKTFCTIEIEKKCKLYLDELAIYCQPMSQLDEYVMQRKTDSLEQVDVSENTITGTIRAQKDEFLVFSIPYQSGWSAYVDGAKTEISQANIMYMGIDISKGEHQIALRYETPGLRISLVITAVSLLIFAVAMMVRRQRSKA